MKISVNSFKSIKSVKDFDLKGLNVMAGVNSSGKSSLIQSLLLLKQTIDSGSKNVLRLDGPYIYADTLQELLYKKNKANPLEYEITLDANDIERPELIRDLVYYWQDDTFDRIVVKLAFQGNGSAFVSRFGLYIEGVNGRQDKLEIKRNASGLAAYQVQASNGRLIGINGPLADKKVGLKSCAIDFSGFFPVFGECFAKKSKISLFSLPMVKVLEKIFEIWFAKFYYIGPIRVTPALLKSYNTSPSLKYVGSDGDNTRYILQENKMMKVNGSKTLTQEINYWVCDRLKLAQQIDTTKDLNKLYRTQLVNLHNLKIDLCHMGFGISQILPILVQGLILPENSIFIVEDPCVHMHPSIQAGLMDFFLEIMHRGNHKIIIETHSDHIITRLRRRIAEGTDQGDVNLIFVEPTEDGSTYNTIGITGQGAFSERLPKGFLDTAGEDLRSILENRLKK
ncbi:MAG: AAA family ATPase [Bacteroidales bacterium]|nr:AAA family ATPase [Bacteroidales bacterium]